MTEDEKDQINYRFGGYQPPLIQLDSTGPAYWLKIGPHPYYVNQPACWQQPTYRVGGVKHFGTVNLPPDESNGKTANLYPLLDHC